MKINIVKRIKSISALLLMSIVLFILASIVYDRFLTFANLTNLIRQASMMGLIAIGMTFVILTGGIDLSVGSTLALTGLLAAYFSKGSFIVAFFLPLLIGCGLGLINGLVITRLHIIPMIATLATQMGIRGIAYIISDVRTLPVDGNAAGLKYVGQGYFLGIPVPAIIFIFFIVVSIVISNKTRFGRSVYAVGGNAIAARFMGLKVRKTTALCYVISGGLSALAGVILAGRLSAGQAVAGMGYEMTAIAAVAIGGTYFTGGIGKFSGTFIAIIFIYLLSNVINLQGNINAWWQQIVTGFMLLVVVVIHSQAKKK
ncbi:MAG: ABC transporter permease [Treponema sp.]|jgi:ribose transport system permease protein|nr:ABC transporter permease [Treponema sp.]